MCAVRVHEAALKTPAENSRKLLVTLLTIHCQHSDWYKNSVFTTTVLLQVGSSLHAIRQHVHSLHRLAQLGLATLLRTLVLCDSKHAQLCLFMQPAVLHAATCA
jgi:hypothetical protein